MCGGGGNLTKMEKFGIDRCNFRGLFSANLGQKTPKDMGSISKKEMSTFGDLQFQLIWPKCLFQQFFYIFINAGLKPKIQVEVFNPTAKL